MPGNMNVRQDSLQSRGMSCKMLLVGVQSAGHPEEVVEYAHVGQRQAIVATKSELMVQWGIGSRLDE